MLKVLIGMCQKIALIMSIDEFLFIVFEVILGSVKPVPLLSGSEFTYLLIVYTSQDKSTSEVENP